MKAEREIRDEIVRYGMMLYQRGYVAAMDGNISVRLDDGTILVTPTCMCKGLMSADDIVHIDGGGRKLHGHRRVSSELGMHLLIYEMRPEIRGIVHAHPPTATGFAAAGLALDQPILSEVLLTLGSIPLARYATPGSKELAEALQPLVLEHNAILMANHGVVAFAEELERAYMHMETVEHFAKIALTSRLLGRQQLLTDDDVRKLTEIRLRLEGKQPSSGNGSGGAGTRTPAAPAEPKIPVEKP
ncbi:MAG TPA: class II aldolase/adducin family protein [Terriglobales bacterium]|nr:class II aldolase/adducin family protein [Terriglobales bacterium]